MSLGFCDPARPCGSCVKCRLAGKDPRYAALFGLPGPAAARPAVCGHRGGQTGEKIPCQTCSGNVLIHVFACGLHARCTDSKEVPGVKCCRTCADNSTKKAPADSPAGAQ